MTRLLVSFSGGETSALMCHLIMGSNSMRSEYEEIRVVFANTGQENEQTLEFVDRCSRHFGWPVTWIEAVTPPERGIGARWREVTFETADRQGAVFEEMIAKHGIPNQAQPVCSKELKGRPITRWARDNGWMPGTYDLAIGIRKDEVDRISPSAKERRIIYPLISRFPHTKQAVNEFWLRQPFRLELKGYQGNCRWCWKKSLRKHLTIISEDPGAYDFPERMEAKYPHAGANKTGEPRRFFRGNRTVGDLRAMAAKPFSPADDDARAYQISIFDVMNIDMDMDLDACGSGESCEVDFGE